MSLVVYLFEIKKREDFAKCSNFLYKFMKEDAISVEETDNVYYLISNHKVSEAQKVCKDIVKQKDQMQRILQPIKQFSKKYEILFIIWMNENEMNEIVAYQDAILIQAYFSELPIYCITSGNSDFYFKLSQFLFCTLQEKNLDKKYYYYQYGENNIKRIQQRNIHASTSFFPLLLVTEENVKKLRSNCIEQLGEKTTEQIFKLKSTSGEISANWKELDSVVKLFVENRKVFGEIPKEYLRDRIRKMDTLSLILLGYSMKNLSKWHEKVFKEELRGYIDIIQQYANACFQLLENILFHSDTKWGVLSIRIHRAGEEYSGRYLSDTYGDIEKENTYFEVIIRDYAGRILSGNIAQHFRSKLGECEKSRFERLVPKNMFCSSLGESDEFEEAWKQFYYEPQNIGKHFGLRIFQRIVSEHEGYFIAESHRQHRCERDDSYCYHINRKADKYVLPGTGYYVLLPLKKMQKHIMDENRIYENGNWLCNKPYNFFELKTEYLNDYMKEGVYGSQYEKEAYIKREAKKIEDFVKEKKNIILAINASHMDGADAELSVKILNIALFAMKRKISVILYNCIREFIEQFTVLMKELYAINLEEMFMQHDFQIVLISDQYLETVFVPGSIKKTDGLNLYISRLRGTHAIQIQEEKAENIIEYVSSYIPADLFIKIDGMTLFQKCVKEVLQRNIQKEEFGCQICDTHMRLGSTIHINHFFEAEILFGVKYFRVRFACMILNDILKDIRDEKYVTLYGYASYSEPLLVELKNALETINEGQYVDYIVLEREEERRGFSHKDRIRYSDQKRADTLHQNKGVVDNRKYIVIVPINSTLKTHQRLINLLEEQDCTFRKENVIKNFALILVGPEKNNEYWERSGNNELICRFGDIVPNPVYYVNVEADYNEPLTCPLCFPENPLLEEPLIEVNAASTIPNQSFGFVCNTRFRKEKLDMIPQIISQEEEHLADLKECFLYGHFERNEEHFLYYILTEKLVTLAYVKIVDSLKKWNPKFVLKQNEHHILVAPMHYSNCGFVEMVNVEKFAGMASILRIDFKKDFRSNTYTKYSYIRQYIKQLSEAENACFKFHYVDDCIITGRTFHRAKSLVESIVGDRSDYNSMGVEIKIFDRIFVLVDRNSSATKKQYISGNITDQEIDEYYYKYIQLEISSLRNYGDACVICNLHREAELLNRTSTTEIVLKNWEEKKKTFGIKPIEVAANKLKPEFQKRAFRRMMTTHIVKVVMSMLEYNYQKENAAAIFLAILNRDCTNRKEDSFEYFISYLKVGSRPFLSFDKSVKEAVFDILLNVICYIIDADYATRCKKSYWKSTTIKKEWEDIEDKMLRLLNAEQRRQLLLVAMKQLTELKSNYIIRSKTIQGIEQFISSNNFSTEKIEDFWNRYHIMVKRLTGVSSDTSKSYWLDYMCYHKKEFGSKDYDTGLQCAPKVQEILILENTRNFQDGILKMYQGLRYHTEMKEALDKYLKTLLNEEYHNLCLLHILEQRKKRLLQMDQTLCVQELQKLLTEDCACSPGRAKSIFNQGLSIEESIEICKEKLRDSSKQLEEKTEELLSELGAQYSLRDYQFKNFQGFCCKIGWYNCGQYTKDGFQQIAGCIGIKDICEESKKSDEEIQIGLKKFVNLSAQIMKYGQVQLLVECENSAEYYKEQIEAEYKKAALERNSSCALKIEKKRCYSILASSTGNSMYITDEVQEYLNDESLMSEIQKYGYYYNTNTEIFLWRLGDPEICPVFLFVKYSWDETTIYRIRNLMMFKWDLEHSIFAKEKLGYLRELAYANNRLELYKGRKIVSHTDIKRRRYNFQGLISRMDNPTKEEKSDYSMDMLILLADLRVSDIYRQSLNRNFYSTSDRFKSIAWKTDWNMLRDRSTIKESGETGVTICIRNEGLLAGDHQLEDEDILTATDDTADELFSLLLALVLNPVKKDRGKISEDKKLDVYIYKTAKNTIRIANPTVCDETVLPKIRRSLEHEPVRDEEGITLWSLNCYLKRVKVAYAGFFLENAKRTGGLEDARRQIMELLTDEGYSIRVGIEQIEENKYFWCEIPVLSVKYEKR